MNPIDGGASVKIDKIEIELANLRQLVEQLTKKVAEHDQKFADEKTRRSL